MSSRLATTVSAVGVSVLLIAATTASAARGPSLQPKRSVIGHASQAGGVLIAPPAACPGSTQLDVPAAAAEQAMLCMTDFARRGAGLASLTVVESLTESARLKALDLLACREFSHEACGREFTYWMGQTGYLALNCWRVGEDLAWGRGEWGTARSIFIAWMQSPTHREIVLGDYLETGVDVETGYLEGGPRTRVWTQHFGAAGCPPPPQS